jgi:hypothetical protein
MDLSAVLPAFLLAVVLISASPGPAMALVLRRAALYGTRAAVPTVLGLELGLYLWALAAGPAWPQSWLPPRSPTRCCARSEPVCCSISGSGRGELPGKTAATLSRPVRAAGTHRAPRSTRSSSALTGRCSPGPPAWRSCRSLTVVALALMALIAVSELS